ncbi:hypothetical protein K438DRAFT_58595 [Mycena galopus ATCC 62051]|nr:hypothetical protein K438DRAFT_58595 [Mycena galopus ATCC 62051]
MTFRLRYVFSFLFTVSLQTIQFRTHSSYNNKDTIKVVYLTHNQPCLLLFTPTRPNAQMMPNNTRREPSSVLGETPGPRRPPGPRFLSAHAEGKGATRAGWPGQERKADGHGLASIPSTLNSRGRRGTRGLQHIR